MSLIISSNSSKIFQSLLVGLLPVKKEVLFQQEDQPLPRKQTALALSGIVMQHALLTMAIPDIQMFVGSLVLIHF